MHNLLFDFNLLLAFNDDADEEIVSSTRVMYKGRSGKRQN
jgi:hypothetical protein